MSTLSSQLPSGSATQFISYPLPFCWEIGSTKVEISPEEISLQLRVASERALRIEKVKMHNFRVKIVTDC
jgi:hypothetical protein